MLTFTVAELNSTMYWRYSFNSICNPKQLVEYVVIDIEPVIEKEKKPFPGQGTVSLKHVLADAWIVKASELGINENTIHTKTHLGHVLKPGDSALGYNIEDSNINDDNFEKLDKESVPDVILVKKYYGDKAARRRQRMWKLKHMAEETTALNVDVKCVSFVLEIKMDSILIVLFCSEYNEFLEDLEEDPALRKNINIFKDSSKQLAIDSQDQIDATIPYITLEEMLDDLVIEDVEMKE